MRPNYCWCVSQARADYRWSRGSHGSHCDADLFTRRGRCGGVACGRRGGINQSAANPALRAVRAPGEGAGGTGRRWRAVRALRAGDPVRTGSLGHAPCALRQHCRLQEELELANRKKALPRLSPCGLPWQRNKCSSETAPAGIRTPDPRCSACLRRWCFPIRGTRSWPGRTPRSAVSPACPKRAAACPGGNAPPAPPGRPAPFPNPLRVCRAADGEAAKVLSRRSAWRGRGRAGRGCAPFGCLCLAERDATPGGSLQSLRGQPGSEPR